MAQNSFSSVPILDAGLAILNNADAANTTPEAHAKLQDSAARQGVPAALLEQETPKNLHAADGAYDFKRAAINSPAMLKVYEDINSAKAAQDDRDIMSRLSDITKTSLNPAMHLYRVGAQTIAAVPQIAASTETGIMKDVRTSRKQELDRLIEERAALQRVKLGELDFETFRSNYGAQLSGIETAKIGLTPAPASTVEEWEQGLQERISSTGASVESALKYKPMFANNADYASALQEINKAETVGQALMATTPSVVLGTVTESLFQDTSALAAQIGLTAFGGIPGAVAGAGVMAKSTYDLNYENETLDFLIKSGVDFTNPDALAAVYASPEYVKAAEAARAKATVDAGINAVPAAAAPFVRPITALFAGATAGGAGEYFGEQAAGREPTTGGVYLEVVGDVVTGAVDAAVAAQNSSANKYDAKIWSALISRVQKQAQKVEVADRFGAALDEFTSVFSSMKMLKTDPTVAQKFAEELNVEGAPKDLFLDPQALQQANVDIAELSKLSPTFAARVGEAVATGGTVQVPFSEYVTLIAPTMGNKLNDHVRAEPDGFSRAEAEEFMQTQAELVKTEAANIAAEAKLSEPFEASAAAVEEKIFSQLKTTGRFTDTVNRFYAKLTASAFTVNGAKLGLTAEQFYNEFGGLNIVGEQETVDVGPTEGEEVGNGFRKGPEEGTKYRVSTSNAIVSGAVLLEKRSDLGTGSTFYVGKDGGLIDADNVAANETTGNQKENVWTAPSETHKNTAMKILSFMGNMKLGSPARKKLQKTLKDLVTGKITPQQAEAEITISAPSASPAVFTQTYKGMPLDQDGRLKVTHFSATKGITKLDPDLWGTTGAALPRSERNRQGLVPNRAYGYLGSDFKKENQLGDVRYTGFIDPSRYYDLESDPLNLKQRGAAISNERRFNDVTAGIELAVQEAGFDGYIAKAPQGGLAVVSYKPIDVTEGDANDSGQTGAEGLQDGSGVRGSSELLDATRRANLEPLEGAPGPVKVAGRGKVQFGPFAPARAAAEAYMASTGRVYQPPKKHVKIDAERAKRIAQEFELMEHDPLNPVVESAYRAMIDETLAQYQFVKQTGLKVEFLQPDQQDPYAASPRLATLDVIENNHLWVFPTDSGFGGPASANVDITDNPLLQPTQEFVDGKQLLANDVFRIVHDYFGHIKDGQGFRAEGEENAWQSHAAMFSPLARRALTTETRGQNSWVNFGPYAEKNKTASGADTEYAPQKIGLLPEWVSQEGFEGGVDSGKVGVYEQFAGTNASTANIEMLERAKRMVGRYDADTVRKRTGWFQGKDNQWRFEISDAEAATYRDIDEKIKQLRAQKDFTKQEIKETKEYLEKKAKEAESTWAEYVATSDGARVFGDLQDLQDILAVDIKELDRLSTEASYLVDPDPNVTYRLERVLNHPKLFAAYPHLRNVRVRLEYDKNQVARVKGYFLYNAAAADPQIVLTAIDKDAMMEGLLHEIQHAVQKKEGFARGGSQEEIKDALVRANKEYTNTMSRLEDSPAAEELIQEFKDTFKADLPAAVFLPSAVNMVATDALAEEAQQFNAAISREDMVEWLLEHPTYKILAQELQDAASARESKVGTAIQRGPYQTYRALAGETEARNVERRRLMSEDARANVAPEVSQDIPFSEQIVIFEDGSEAKFVARSETQTAGPRGTFNPKTNTIALLKAANLSTFIHESGHLFLEMLAFSAAHPNAQADIKADMDAALKWMGVSDITGNRMEVWNTLTLEQKRPFHEKWARGFEAYLFEGKSPAVGLADVFRRMKHWLMRVYRDNIANLNVELDPEIRGVFDRMVATSDQIKEAQNMRAYEALFDDQAESGMADAEFRVYEALQTTSTQEALEELQRRSLRDMQWMTNAKSREMKKLQKRNVAKRREVREEVRAELMTQPAYQAIKFFKTGQYEAPVGASKEVRDAYLETSVQNHKLSLPVLKESYGEEGNALWRFLQGGKYGFVAQEGMHPDAAATMFGYDSGDAMIRDILATPDFNDTVEGMTDQRMLEQYGDLIDERAMERAAEKAIHNEARSKVIATEMNALQKAAGKTRIMASMAKAYADDAIGKLLVREVRPGQYTRQEAKAARESAEAFRKGDIETAAIKKRAQLLQNYSAKAAFNALDDVEKAIRYFKKFDKASIAKKISPEYVDQIHQLLDRYELTTTTLKALDKRKSLRDFVERQQELGIEPNIPPEVMDEVSRKNYREATVDELRGLYDTIKQIEHLGRLKNKLLTAKDQRDFDATVDQIVTNIRAKGPKRILDNTTRASNWEATKINFKGYLAMHRKVGSIGRQLDGFEDGGIFWDTFIRTMNDAGAMEAKMREETTAKMLAIIQPLLSSRPFADAFGSKKEFYPSVGRSLNREERMAIALNVGNAGNLQRLLDGEGWQAQQITPILDSLGKQEWDAIQSIWDLFESFRPQIAAKEKRVYGVEPKWVEPTPVITPHGEYRGGYYPIKYDGRRNDKAAAFNEAEEAKALLKGAFLSATTRRSFTKARSDEVKGRPLLYTMDGMYSGLNDVIHDLTWHEWVIDMNRMMRDGRVSSAVRDIYGDPTLKQIKSAVRDIAGGDAMPADPFERGLADLRAGATVAGLGFNLVNSLINVTGMTQSFSRIGARWMLVGLREMSTRPRDLVQEVHERSDMMRTRMRTRGREINEIQSRIRGKSTTREKVDNLMFAPMYLTQMMVDTPTWWGAYQKSLLEFGDESKAAALADQAVLDAQTGGQIKDLAAIQRGSATMKLFTTFYGYFSGTYNLAVEKTKKTDFSNPGDIVRLGGDYLLLAVVPAVLTTLVKTVMNGNDEDWELDKFAKKAAAESAGFALATMVGVREFGGMVQMLSGTNYGTSGYGGPAGLRFFSEVYKLANQVSQGEADSALMKAFVNVIGVIFKLPSAQINRTLTGTDALIEGETDNPLAIIGGPPLK
jgi:hypothetical protein